MTALAALSARSLLDWFNDRHHWRGANGIPHRLFQHLSICGIALLVAVVVAVPIGVVLGHLRRGGLVAQNVANLGRAIPSLAILIIAVPFLGIGSRPAELALIALAIPPLLTNTYVGMAGVDDDVRDATRGLGMTGWQAVRRAELPLALPLVLAGLRTASFQVVATATLAAVVASGGLGQFITEGIELRDNAELVGGSLLVVALAIAVEGLIALLARLVVPAPLRDANHTAARRSTTNRFTTDEQLEESFNATALDPAA